MDSEFWHFPHLSLTCFPLRLGAPGIILASKESLCLRAGALPVREPTEGPGDPGKSWSGLGAARPSGPVPCAPEEASGSRARRGPEERLPAQLPWGGLRPRCGRVTG